MVYTRYIRAVVGIGDGRIITSIAHNVHCISMIIIFFFKLDDPVRRCTRAYIRRRPRRTRAKRSNRKHKTTTTTRKPVSILYNNIILCRSSGNGPRPSDRPRGPSQEIRPSAPPSCMPVNRNITYNFTNFNDDDDVIRGPVRRSLPTSSAERERRGISVAAEYYHIVFILLIATSPLRGVFLVQGRGRAHTVDHRAALHMADISGTRTRVCV